VYRAAIESRQSRAGSARQRRGFQKRRIALMVPVFRGKESPVFWFYSGYFNRYKVMKLK